MRMLLFFSRLKTVKPRGQHDGVLCFLGRSGLDVTYSVGETSVSELRDEGRVAYALFRLKL